MIFWIASYPKSGNTWLRTLISTYYFSEKGIYTEKLLKLIDQFPTRKYFSNFEYNQKIAGDTCKFWIKAQEKINQDQKLKFFKTHNTFGKLNNFDFTNIQNSIGCIYIVRDPRNVITSLKNHYELDDDKALKWITNNKNYVYDVENFNDVGYGDFQFISSWNINYNSWKLQKKIPTMLVKYEDLEKQTYSVFREIVKFINNTTKINSKINLDKIKNTLNSTSFDKLKQKEINNGFSEAVNSSKNRNKKISFFHLGPRNDWRKLLDDDSKVKLNKVFNKEMKELNYI